MTNSPLTLFVRESNWIEGIRRDPTSDEIEAHRLFLSLNRIDIPALQMLVTFCQPGAVLRGIGMDVRVGDHLPPPGGPDIRDRLQRICNQVAAHNLGAESAFNVHREYENLHPFTDGNGRSGRALWLKMMGGPENVPLGFLHTWYYQSLSAGDGR